MDFLTHAPALRLMRGFASDFRQLAAKDLLLLEHPLAACQAHNRSSNNARPKGCIHTIYIYTTLTLRNRPNGIPLGIQIRYRYTTNSVPCTIVTTTIVLLVPTVPIGTPIQVLLLVLQELLVTFTIEHSRVFTREFRVRSASTFTITPSAAVSQITLRMRLTNRPVRSIRLSPRRIVMIQENGWIMFLKNSDSE